VFRGLTLRGFNARSYCQAHAAHVSKALSHMAALVAALKLAVVFTEYELSEWEDAVEHAAGEHGGACGGSRALVMMPGLPGAFA